MVFAALAGSAGAQTQQDAIATAFEICTTQPTTIDEIRETLLQHGWQNNEPTTLSALFNAKIAFDFNADDLRYTFENAFFIAASVLGNSSLGSDQIGVTFEDYQLAMIGIVENTPYCVLTGPNELIKTFANGGWVTQTQVTTDLVSQGIWTDLNGSSATVGVINIEAIQAALKAAELPNEDVVKLLAPVTIYFVITEVPS